MQLIVDMPEDYLQRYEDSYYSDGRAERAILDAVINYSKRLPKRHGRLIDADALRYKAETCIETTDGFIELIDSMRTIVESDSDMKDKKNDLVNKGSSYI